MIPYLNKPKLTVVTSGVMHASLLADQNVRTILVGGELKNTTKAIIGVKAVSSLTQLRFNKAFLGINGIHPRYGFTTPDPDEAAVKTTALEQSEECFVLADPSKFDNVSFVKVAELSQANDHYQQSFTTSESALLRTNDDSERIFDDLYSNCQPFDRLYRPVK